MASCVPIGIQRLADERLLSEGVRIDVPSRFEDDAELLRAARAGLSQH